MESESRPARRGRRVAICTVVVGILALSACGIAGAESAVQDVRVQGEPKGPSSPSPTSSSTPPSSKLRPQVQLPLQPQEPPPPAQPVPVQPPPPPAQPVPVQPPPPPQPGPPTSPLPYAPGATTTAQVVLSGPGGVALRAAPDASSELRGRAQDGTTLGVDCAVFGALVAVGSPRYQEASVWIRTSGDAYVTLLYLQVAGYTSLPDCQPGRPAVPLTINPLP